MLSEQSSSATEHFNKLIQFRQEVYDLLGKAHDAMFELSDAVIQIPSLHSFVELSCAPTFRRKWPSAYEALQDSRPNQEGLLRLYQRQLSGESYPILAGDHTAWQRIWSPTLEDRSYQHQSTPIPGRRPVTIGHGYSTLAFIPEAHSSWALPVSHVRIKHQKPIETAAQQLCEIDALMIGRFLSIWDAEYGCASFLSATNETKKADKLIRLRVNLSLEGPTKPGKPNAKQPIHGIKFKFKDDSTWWKPDQVEEYDDPVFGLTTVQVWEGLRFSKALECRMTVARVERHQAPDTRRQPRILWFAWKGEKPPQHWWNLYSRRYPIEHWYRFIKGRLHWTLPRLGTPEQGERWSELMPFITWELWFARSIVEDNPLPWQKPKAKLSQGRVCQGMSNLLMVIGTPVGVCKTRGIPPGWPCGYPRTPRKRYALVRSARWINIRAKEKAKKDAQKPKRGRPKKKTAEISA